MCDIILSPSIDDSLERIRKKLCVLITVWLNENRYEEIQI